MEDSFVFTFSGYMAGIDNPPTISDICQSLFRLPRFSGNTKDEWNVLCHSICVALICYLNNDYNLIHASLLHDASESMTGDIPSPFKNEELIKLEEKLLRSIFKNNNVYISRVELDRIKEYDTTSLVAEALETMDKKCHKYFLTHYKYLDKHLSLTRKFVRSLYSRYNEVDFWGRKLLRDRFHTLLTEMKIGLKAPKTLFKEFLAYLKMHDLIDISLKEFLNV